jgi:hypothetical protein
LLPARQPTTASTEPAWAPREASGVAALSGGATTTSVTMLAEKHPSTSGPLPVQSGAPAGTPAPVGRFAFVKLAPASVERYRPAPVAA